MIERIKKVLATLIAIAVFFCVVGVIGAIVGVIAEGWDTESMKTPGSPTIRIKADWGNDGKKYLHWRIESEGDFFGWGVRPVPYDVKVRVKVEKSFRKKTADGNYEILDYSDTVILPMEEGKTVYGNFIPLEHEVRGPSWVLDSLWVGILDWRGGDAPYNVGKKRAIHWVDSLPLEISEKSFQEHLKMKEELKIIWERITRIEEIVADTLEEAGTILENDNIDALSPDMVDELVNKAMERIRNLPRLGDVESDRFEKAWKIVERNEEEEKAEQRLREKLERRRAK